MVFSDTTNKNGIVQYTEDLCKLGDGGITGDTTLFKKITAYINQAYKNVAIALLRVDRRWKWDDSNYTDFPIASIDIVSGQRDYTLPASTSGGNNSTLWRVNKVEILTGGQYQKIDLMEPDEEEVTTSATPSKYNLISGSIRFKELPSANITSGLRITFQRSLTEFTTASTTTQPGFMDAYHDLLAYSAASDYLMPFDTNLATVYSNKYEARLKLLQKDYSIRNDDVTRRLSARNENTR